MNDWKKIKLEDVIDTLKGGIFKSEDYISSGIPIIRVSDFTEDSISENELVYIDENLAKKYLKYELKHNNIVIQTVGSWQNNPASVVGKVIKVPKHLSGSLLNQNAVKIIPKEDVDELFLYYRLKDESFKSHVLGCAQGAANQASITLSTINRFSFLIPPLPTQQKIAAILSRYDDLIENNLKQIKLLEEMAQITYQEWFVRFKFPNHENTPIDEKTGLPVGWEKRKIKDLCLDITDGTHDTPKEVNDGIKLITGKHIDNGFINFETAYLISKEDHEQIKKRSGLNKGDILFSNIGTLGSIGVVTQNFEFSCKNVIIFKFKKGYSHFLYTYLANENTKNKLSAQSAGVAQKFYSLNFIRNFEDYLPTNELIELFDEKFSNIYTLKYQLHEQNQLLKEARDILLPRLMTGKINVGADLSALCE